MKGKCKSKTKFDRQDVAVSQLVSANTSATCVSAGTLLQLAHVGDNWHSNSGTPIASGGTVENEGNSSIEGAATGRELVEGSSRGGSVENSASGVVTGSSSVTDGTPVIEGESEVTNATNSMHTEEEDVATFLATQLASQAAPPQTTGKYIEKYFAIVHRIFFSIIFSPLDRVSVYFVKEQKERSKQKIYFVIFFLWPQFTGPHFFHAYLDQNIYCFSFLRNCFCLFLYFSFA